MGDKEREISDKYWFTGRKNIHFCLIWLSISFFAWINKKYARKEKGIKIILDFELDFSSLSWFEVFAEHVTACMISYILRNKFCVFLRNTSTLLTLLAQDVILTSIQRFLNVMDVRWTLKQRCVAKDLVIKIVERVRIFDCPYKGMSMINLHSFTVPLDPRFEYFRLENIKFSKKLNFFFQSFIHVILIKNSIWWNKWTKCDIKLNFADKLNAELRFSILFVVKIFRKVLINQMLKKWMNGIRHKL